MSIGKGSAHPMGMGMMESERIRRTEPSYRQKRPLIQLILVSGALLLFLIGCDASESDIQQTRDAIVGVNVTATATTEFTPLPAGKSLLNSHTPIATVNSSPTHLPITTVTTTATPSPTPTLMTPDSVKRKSNITPTIFLEYEDPSLDQIEEYLSMVEVANFTSNEGLRFFSLKEYFDEDDISEYAEIYYTDVSGDGRLDLVLADLFPYYWENGILVVMVRYEKGYAYPLAIHDTGKYDPRQLVTFEDWTGDNVSEVIFESPEKRS